jgi:hypothetical protein
VPIQIKRRQMASRIFPIPPKLNQKTIQLTLKEKPSDFD